MILFNWAPQADHTVWLGIRRAPGGRWVGENGQPVTSATADWADGQPIVAGDCAVADAAAGYKWRATSCEDSHTFVCTLSRPNCPRGYKYREAIQYRKIWLDFRLDKWL